MKRKKLSVFEALNAAFLFSLAMLGIIPFIHMIAVAFSGGVAASANLVGLWPIDFSTNAIHEVVQDKSFLNSFGTSIQRVFLGTTITMGFTILTAYPVSLNAKEFPARKYYVAFMVVTMLFSGGLLPAYILNTRIGLVDTIWALVVPGAVPIFNVIVLLNFYRGIPVEIREAAMIDGANDFQCLGKIFLPLSKPCLATLTMFCVIGHWNNWFDGLLYMRDNTKYPLQTYLQVYLSSLSDIKSQQEVVQMLETSDRSLMYAYIVLSCIPIILVFPLLSKHIKSGLVLGSVKG